MRFRCLVVGSLLVSSLLCQAQDKELPAEVVARLDAAVSAAPAVKPKAPRKVLVVYRCDGFRHRCIPVANKMLERLAARSGAFEATFTDKMDVFDAERLARFVAILFNNTTRLKFGERAAQGADRFRPGGQGGDRPTCRFGQLL